MSKKRRSGDWLNGAPSPSESDEFESLQRIYPKLTPTEIKALQRRASEQFAESTVGDPRLVLTNVARAIRTCIGVAKPVGNSAIAIAAREAIKWHQKTTLAFEQGMEWSRKRKDTVAMDALSRMLVYAIYLGGAAKELHARTAFPQKPQTCDGRISCVSAAVKAYRADPKNGNKQPTAKSVYSYVRNEGRPSISTFGNWFSEWKRFTKGQS